MLRGGCQALERRRHLSDSLSWQQDQALNSSIYLLREMGPTGFLLREEEPEFGDFRVLLGNPHVCNCSTFLKGKELCKHICWILLKKFKLPRNHESAFQLGLAEGEINDLLRGIHQVQTPQPGPKDQISHVEEDGHIKQKEVGSDDICPICQEVLLEKRLPVTYCRFGCGNNVHIKCMKILANYPDMISSMSMLKCPLCREEFAPLKVILKEFKNASKLVTTSEKERLDKHLGIPCNHCEQFPIEGKCYKCTRCVEYHLCQDCFESCCHLSHTFTYREKRNQRWKAMGTRSNEVKYSDIKREIEDVPCVPEKQGQVCTPKHVVKSLPLLLVTKKSRLLAPGYQCRLCLKPFCLGQYTRLLPCSHKFHRKCIDSWLFHKCNSCPIDGQAIYNPLLWKGLTSERHAHQSASDINKTYLSKQEEPKLFVPGTGLVLQQHRLGILPRRSQCNSKMLAAFQDPSESYQNITIDDLCSVKLDDSDSRKLIYEHKVNQHFPRYLQDLACGPPGKMPSRTFLPSLFHKSSICPTGKESPWMYEKYHTGHSQKMAKGCKHINHDAKKTFVTKRRQENKRTNMLLTEGLNLTVNQNMTSVNLPKRYNNCTRKIRQKCNWPPRRPVYHSLQTKSSALSLIIEGVQL